MDLSVLGNPTETCRLLRQDFEFEYAFQRYVLEEKRPAVTLAGLRAPPAIQEWGSKRHTGELADVATEVAFQAYLDERIASLAGNYAFLSQHREIAERTHDFRTLELLDPIVSRHVLGELADLWNALRDGRLHDASSVLVERFQRRSDILTGQPLRTRRQILHAVT